jgi:polar amino acid transport system substrate-binding protein
LVAYNNEHPDAQINIDTTAGSTDILVADFKAGLIDAYVVDDTTREQINENYDIELVAVGEPVTKELARFALNLEDEQLLSDVNEALETLRDNGQLAQLATQYIGYDASAGISAED